MASPRTADYILTIPNIKSRTYDLLGWLLISIHLIILIIILILSANYEDRKWAGFGVALAIIFFLFEILFRKKKSNFSAIRACLAYLPVIWIFRFNYYIPGIISLLLSILYFISKREFRVYISEDQIRFPSFPVKSIKWAELNNLVLKDGLLTIDFKNNKLIQQAIDENSPVNEQEFNEFCRQHLKK